MTKSLYRVLFVSFFIVCAFWGRMGWAQGIVQYAQNDYAYLKWNTQRPDWVYNNYGPTKHIKYELYRNEKLISTLTDNKYEYVYEDRDLSSIDLSQDVAYKVIEYFTYRKYGSDVDIEDSYEHATGTIPVIDRPDGEGKIRPTFGSLRDGLSTALPAGMTVISGLTIYDGGMTAEGNDRLVYIQMMSILGGLFEASYGVDLRFITNMEIRGRSSVEIRECSMTAKVQSAGDMRRIQCLEAQKFYIIKCQPHNLDFNVFNTDNAQFRMDDTNLDPIQQYAENCRFAFSNIQQMAFSGDLKSCQVGFNNVLPFINEPVFQGGMSILDCRFSVSNSPSFRGVGGFFTGCNMTIDSDAKFENAGFYGPGMTINIGPDSYSEFIKCQFKSTQWGNPYERQTNKSSVYLNCQSENLRLNGSFYGGTIEAKKLRLDENSELDLLQSQITVDRLEIENFHSIANDFTVHQELTGTSGEVVRGVWFDALRTGPEESEPLFGPEPIGGQLQLRMPGNAALDDCKFTCSQVQAEGSGTLDLSLTNSYFYRGNVQIQKTNSATLKGNTFDANDSNDVSIWDANSVFCEKNLFRCVLFPGQLITDTIYATGLILSRCQNIAVAENHFEDFGGASQMAFRLSACAGEILRNTFKNCPINGLYASSVDLSSIGISYRSPILQVQNNLLIKSCAQLLGVIDSHITSNSFYDATEKAIYAYYCNDLLINRNYFQNGTSTDIYMEYCQEGKVELNESFADNAGTGLTIINSKTMLAIDNLITRHKTGVTVRLSEDVQIFGNTIRDNSRMGIEIGYSNDDKTKMKNALIYNNWIANAASGGVNAQAYGTNVLWNLSEKKEAGSRTGGPYQGGNYWDDYTGEDTNGDGIGDTKIPYTILTTSTNRVEDYMPLFLSADYPTPTPLRTPTPTITPIWLEEDTPTPYPFATATPTATQYAFATATPTPVPLPTSTPSDVVRRVIVTDDETSDIDLSNQQDFDAADNRALCIRWRFVPPFEGVLFYNIYISVDGGDYRILTRSADVDTYYLWKPKSKNLEPYFQDGPLGPQFGKSYKFFVEVMQGRTKTEIFANKGPVLFLEEIDPTPTPTPPGGTAIDDWRVFE
ncbi:MAG: right-handed parallel beta-helix repeat-containing protein [Candidatus Omnitrophota bacterium]